MTIDLGGSGGTGGTGGDLTINNTAGGTISTSGRDSAAIRALSVGANGGAGGQSNSSTYSAGFGPDQPQVYFTMSIAGNGGGGGDGGTVNVTNTGMLTTTGDQSPGIQITSVGGGGEAGNAQTMTLAAGLSKSVSIGVAAGGADGNGGNVYAYNNTTSATITTSGFASHGILAQSIGGGWGTGGAATSYGSQLLNATITMGGNGGAAGSGGTVIVIDSGTITTSGDSAFGILAQSIGGGGGFATDGSGLDVNTLTVKGSLGNSSSGNLVETGGGVTITFEAGSSIATSGNGATAVVAQSIGGGGGYTGALDATSGMTYANFLPPVKRGVEVNANMVGGDVTIVSNGVSSITTTGTNAHGIVAQSLSGGGGLVGNSGGLIIPTGSTTDSRVTGVSGPSPPATSPSTISARSARAAPIPSRSSRRAASSPPRA